ncbi:MAG: hypothetical protein HY719_00415 [Planctomycetes bacterium]|nr:hypothetical protein [Planctomycetota bacterium]
MNPTGLQRYLRLYPPIYSIDCNATNLPDETPFLIEPDRLEDREDDVPWSVAFDGKMHSSYRVIRRTPDGKRIFATRTWKTVKQGGPHSMPIGTHDFLLEEEWSPATIHRVSRRWFKDGDGVSESYLLDWSGRPPDFNTWPPQGGLLPTPSPWPPPVKPLTPDEQRIYERMDSLHTLAGTLQKEKDDAEEIYREAKKEEEIQFGRDPKSDLYRDTKRYLESATDELRRKEDALGIVRRKIDDELSALGVTREPKGRLNAGKPPAEAPGTVAQPTTDPPASASKNELPASDARPGSVSSTKAGGSEAPSASASGGAAIPAPVEAAGGGADRVSQPQGGARRAPSPFAAIGWLEILIAAGVLAAGAAATATAFVLLRRRW